MKCNGLSLGFIYRIGLGSLFLLIPFMAVGCGPPEGISVDEAWGRPSPSSAANAAFYMNIQNHGLEMESLLGAEIDICGSVELHESNVDDNDVMRMEHVEKIDIPSSSTVQLQPGGLHIMCIERQADLQSGDTIDIILEFSEIGLVDVKATIRDQ